MTLEKLKKLFETTDSKIELNYDLKKKNWFNIGGNTKIYFIANSLKDLVLFLKNISSKEKIYVLGAGSNTLISDETFNGAVIKLGKNFSRISLLPNNVIVAGSSVLDKSLASFAASNNIGGFEFLSCIPGTIGGGIRMNAGCFDKEFKDILISIQAIDKTGIVHTIPSKKILFEYRNNDLPEDYIFLSASFKGLKDEKINIEQKMNQLKNLKNKTQPSKIKTGGSTFKNPIDQTDKKAWELIKESIPNDISFGDAYISKKHCNFFINKNNATFNEMNSLINFVKKNVKRKTGININLELKIVE